MNITKKTLSKIIDQKLEILRKGLRGAKKNRDEAQSSIESHHDQTKHSADQLYQSLKAVEGDLLSLKRKMVSMPDPDIFEVKINGRMKRVAIVPEGLGGVTIDGVLLLSENAPLAIKLRK